jgi:hypothetical protein
MTTSIRDNYTLYIDLQARVELHITSSFDGPFTYLRFYEIHVSCIFYLQVMN